MLPDSVPGQTFPFHVVMFGLLGATSLIVVYLLFKLSRANKALTEKNRQIEAVNHGLTRANQELENKKATEDIERTRTDKFYHILVESADDGISFYDRNWNLNYANTAFYSIIGYNKETYFKTDPLHLIHPDDLSYIDQRRTMLEKDGFFEGELRLRHKDGHYVDLLSRSVIVKGDEGEILGALTISRDISRIKMVHEKLKKATEDAETSSRLKSSFLANISHEIRTPLNSVVGFSNLLLAGDISNETKEEYIEHINHNSEKLLQIIGDIIDLSRLESSQIEITYEEASVSEIVNEIVAEARKVIKRNDKSLILNVKNQFDDYIDLIFTDRIWLKRVLSHLMDNAIKFTLDGGIELIYLRDGDNLTFIIKDTGIGINRENLTKIFEEFNQEINGHHRPFEGLGIGLTLAREVVERMGGKITVQSEKGIGSEFSISIPFRPAGSTRSKMKTNDDSLNLNPVNWGNFTCLLVDDNKDVLIYLKKILQETNIKVITARSGIEAVEAVRNTPGLDVILLYMQMPEMNGIEAAGEIRKIDKDIPIIAQTAFIYDDEKDIIIEAGCDACLIKPIRKEHLFTVMASFLSR